MVCHGVQCRARAPAIAFLWRHELRPNTACTCTPLRDDALCREVRSHDVGDEEAKVPNEHRPVRQETEDGGVEAVRDAADGDEGERWGLGRHGG